MTEVSKDLDFDEWEGEFDRRIRVIIAEKLNIDQGLIKSVEDFYDGSWGCDTCEYTQVKLKIELDDESKYMLEMSFTGGLWCLLFEEAEDDTFSDYIKREVEVRPLKEWEKS